MHFHLPRPLHGWREFAGEVGIIVVGILIALGGDQLVEHFRQRAELRAAEEGMVAELRDDDLPQAYARAAIYNCYEDQLDAIEAAVAERDRAKVLKLARDYRPVSRTWDEQAWQAAVASQVLVHAGTDRMLGWSSSYRLIPALSARANAEQEELAQLYANLSGTGPISPEQQDRLFGVISILKRHNGAMNGMSIVFRNYLAEQGLTMTAKEKAAVLSDARRTYGSCVVPPPPERKRPDTQFELTPAGSRRL